MILLTIILVLLFLGVLTIFCAGLWGIFEKAGRKGWKALIPGYNLVVLMEIIGLPWWSVFFLLIPIIPWIIVASELGACFKKTKTWSFFLLIPFFFIGIPILGFGEIKFTPPVNIARTERVFNKFLKFALYFAIIILINIIGVQLFFRFDLTNIGIYSLSKASKQAVATLQEPLMVRAFFSDDLPAEYLDLHQYVQDMFQEYAIYGGKNFNFRFYDVGGEGELTAQEESNREMAQDYGINPIKIQTYKNDTFIYREAYMGMAIIHGDVIETLPQVSSKERLEYNITTTIQKMNNKISALLALEDTIKVKLFLSSDFFGVLTTLTDIPDKVEKIVEELNKENYNKLQYINIDPSKEQLKPEDAALDPKFFLAGTQTDGESIKLYADLVIQYADKIEKYNFLELFRTPWGLQPQLADEDTLREVINETVTNIININEYIGYIADHGSVRLKWDDMELQALAQTKPNLNIPKLTANIFSNVLSENYTVKEINLGEGERIPKGIECLVVAGPRDQFTDWELFQIDQFLMEGKSLAIFYDGLVETEQEMNRQLYGYQVPKQYPPADTGLESLLEHYGASVDSSYIYDENCLTQPHQTYGNLNIYFIPQIQTENINDDLPFMRNIKGLLMIQASPINLYEENLKENNIKTNILFSSSKKSWKISENINIDNPTTIFPPASPDQFRSYPLAVTLEGKFSSYFKGKPVPQKPKKEMDESEKQDSESGFITDEGVTDEVNVIEQAQSPGRIFLVGTSEIIRDLILNYVPPGSLRDTSPNKILISNIIDYCNGKEDYAAMRSKLQLVNPLDETKTTPFAKDFTEYFNLLGLPIIAIICGIIVLLVRTARKKKILLMFSPKGAAAAISTEEMNLERARAQITTSIGSKGLQFTKDYLALVIIVGILLGVLLWSNISRQMGVIQYKLPTLELVQADTVNKMVLTQDDKIITLEKDKNNKWRIMPEGFPADQTQVDSMLGYITDLKITELISKQKQYDRYELDENSKINLRAYAGDALVRQMDIGKVSSTSTLTYVTIVDDPNIYSVKGNLKSLFDKDIVELRDKQVLLFPKDEVTEIILEFDGQTVIIGKQMITPEGEDETAAKPVWMANITDKPVSDTLVNDILTTMSGLVCEEFYTDKQKSDLEAQPFDYRITARGVKDYVLTIFNHPGDNKYPAYSSASDYAFKLVSWRATKMMKKLDDFAEKEPK